VHGGVTVLDAAVVPATEQRPVLVEEGGADRDAALGEPVAGFLDGHGEHAPVQGLVEWFSGGHMLGAQ
jgi:hypothetical protein